MLASLFPLLLVVQSKVLNALADGNESLNFM